MAGNKSNTKTKLKDDKGKMSKGTYSSNGNDELEDSDLSLLRKPLLTSISSFAQARKIYDVATEEIKTLLANECDILYECKVCKNIFRSVANLLSHKRIYCKEKYNPSSQVKSVESISLADEVSKIMRMEEDYQKAIRSNRNQDSPEDRIPLTKDLTTIVEEMTKVKGVAEKTINEKMNEITLQNIPTSKVAVFQNINFDEDDSCSDMRSQVKELQDIFSKDKAVLQPDGNFTVESSISSEKPSPEAENVIQISDDEEVDESDKWQCKICNVKLSTQKTFKFHMKYKHLESRLVYPCPDCCDVFATSWSVYRHLYKVHRKSAAQIRRQRESIQAKAFKMNNPPASYEKRKNNMKAAAALKATNEGKFDRESQAWMDNMEGDGEVPRCGGCGRTFERRAALAAHTHTCQPRSRALARRPLDPKRIEIQIRRDYNKGPAHPAQQTNAPSAALHNQGNTETEDNSATESMNSEIKNSSKSDKIANDLMNDCKQNSSNTRSENLDDDTEIDKFDMITDDIENSNSAISDANKKYRNMNDTEKNDSQGTETTDNVKTNATKENEIIVYEAKFVTKTTDQGILPFYRHVEQNNLLGLKQKMESDVDTKTLQCRKCFIKFVYMHELCYHMACHYNWKRYSCKLCNFKHYRVDAILEHNQVVHKLKVDTELYYLTVKALDTNDALDTNTVDETNGGDVTTTNSRRPSRCSNESSRSSDDSSSCNTQSEITTNRKRKAQQKVPKKIKLPSVTPKKAESANSTDMSPDKVMKIILGDTETPSSSNSSSQELLKDDSLVGDNYADKITKKGAKEETALGARMSRPVRKRIKPKNEDYEYDLSNLLKLEAQGYRDQQINACARNTIIKRKIQSDTLINDTIMGNTKAVSGALLIMTRKADENSRAHMKLNASHFPIMLSNNTNVTQNLIKNLIAYKTAPIEQSSVQSSDPKTDIVINKSDNSTSEEKSSVTNMYTNTKTSSYDIHVPKTDAVDNNVNDTPKEQDKTSESNKTDIPKTAVTTRPIICQKNLEIRKNPLVNQNISDLPKSGVIPKILVIKSVNQAKAKQEVANGPIKLKTIKIKDIAETKNKITAIDSLKLVKLSQVDSQTAPKDKAEITATEDKKCDNIEKPDDTLNKMETDNSV